MSIVSSRSRWAASLVAASVSFVLAGQSLSAAVYVWGNNANGQFGNGTTTNSSVPVLAGGPLATGTVTSIASGLQTNYAVQNGTLYAAGGNFRGQLANGDTTYTDSSAVVTTLLTGNVTAVASGQLYGIALQNGALYSFGFNNSGQLGNGTNTLAEVTPVPVTNMSSGVTAFAAGSNHVLAVKNGAVFAWGNNFRGLGDGTTTASNVPIAVSTLTSGVTKVAATRNANLAIQNGALYGWGEGNRGQLGNNSFANPTTPTLVAGLDSGVTDLASGDGHTLALKNGQVYTLGSNTYGQLGDGTTTTSANPLLIAPTLLTNIVAVAAADYSSYALDADGSLWVWGRNNFGQLGIGSAAATVGTPQHLLAPEGFAYRSIDADAAGQTVIATLVAVPEPAGLSLLGLAALPLARRRR